MYKITVFKALLDLIYPRVCVSCQNTLSETSSPICFNCLLDLPVIGFDSLDQKRTKQKFDGKVRVANALAYLKYEKGNVTQRMMYDLKYKGNKELGIWLGKKFADELIKTNKRDEYDLLLPIPLHKTKLNTRGFNQAALITKGIAEVLKVDMAEYGLIRNANNSSQTKKTRYERFENTTKIFDLSEEIDVKGKHVCVIDDVLTTGATIEAAVEILLENGCSEVSVMTIASAY